jgi:hypothetical protein
MKLLSALNQRLRELQLWQQKAILTVRRAFTFEDIAFDVEAPVLILQDLDFTVAINDAGYGFYCPAHWIAARPDASTRQIVVTKFFGGESTVVRIDTLPIVGNDSPDAESDLRKQIIEFLALVKLSKVPIEW